MLALLAYRHSKEGEYSFNQVGHLHNQRFSLHSLLFQTTYFVHLDVFAGFHTLLQGNAKLEQHEG